MGKVKIGKGNNSKIELKERPLDIAINPEQEHKNPHTGSSFDSFIEREKIEIQSIPREVIIEKHTLVEKQKLDKRLRKYARAVRKQLHSKAEIKSLDLVNARLDLQSERIKDLAQSLDKIHADLEGSKRELEIARLEKQTNKLEHQIELIEQELKVKPVSIKKEVVVERFDHRLTLMTILMLFINAFLVMHILTN